MKKRISIPKGIRFEVFKRDKFTCQYCGREAPDVIFEVDHIVPVVEGGDNELLNLITSCRDCNRGKSKKVLQDDSTIKKQKRVMDELQDRKEMIEMMALWKKELLEEEAKMIDIIDDYLCSISNYCMNDTGRANMKRLIKKFSFSEVYEAVEIAFDRYYNPNYYNDSPSWNYAFNKIGGICHNRRIGRGADYYAK